MLKTQREAFDLLEIGVVIGSKDEIWINLSGEQLTGLPGGALPRRQWSSFLEINPQLKAMIDRATESGRAVYSTLDPLRLVSGGEINAEVRISPLDDGFVMVIIDQPDYIGSRLRWEKRMKELEILALGLSHEVKNPLGSIKGAAQLLRDEDSPEKRKRYSAIILEEVERIDRIIRELLKISSPVQPIKEKINIYEIIDKVLSRLTAEIEEKKLEIVKDYDPSIEPISSDPELIFRIFYNILKNSIDASNFAGKIVIRTRIEFQAYLGRDAGRNKLISIEFEDFGKEVTEDEFRRLFAPFFTTKPEGTGLGLVISQRFAHALGGNITAERKDVGLIFKVVLPVG